MEAGEAQGPVRENAGMRDLWPLLSVLETEHTSGDEPRLALAWEVLVPVEVSWLRRVPLRQYLGFTLTVRTFLVALLA
jgi:hypothetical protein